MSSTPSSKNGTNQAAINLLSKLRTNSKVKEADVLADSAFFNSKVMVPTSVPMINVALSGSLTGGLTPGLTVLAGPSKHFKTSFALLMAAAYLRQYPEAVILFYDTEFGSPQSYFESFGIDTSRVLHTPIKNIEELKFDIIAQLEGLTSSDRCIIIIDSVGNIASKKELDDAIEGKSVADMSRAKALKGLFRMITPYLTMKDIPLLAVNHIYMEQGLYPKAIVSGGTGIYYSANNIWIIGRQQEKDGTEVLGYNLIINIEKSRFVKEKSKIPVEVTWEDGISQWGGLLEVALEGGFVVKPAVGWFQACNPATKEILSEKLRADATYTGEFWNTIFTKTSFPKWIEDRFKVAHKDMLSSVAVTEEDES